MFQRLVTLRSLVVLCLSSAFIVLLTLLALLRSDSVDGGPGFTGGDERQQLEDGERRRSSFIVDTPGCKIPNIDPFDTSIRHLVATDNVTMVCNATPPITYENVQSAIVVDRLTCTVINTV